MQRWCDHRNASLPRNDVEWVVTPTGLQLRDKPSWTAANAKRIAKEAERERADYNHRQRFPIDRNPASDWRQAR